MQNLKGQLKWKKLPKNSLWTSRFVGNHRSFSLLFSFVLSFLLLTCRDPAQAALMKFLDEHNNDPAVGMAMEEAVDAKLLSEEEAREILGRGADGLNWSEMLSDAARNSKLQEFLKSNRWMKRQGFVDFEAKLKDLAQQHRSDLSALEKGIRDLEEEVNSYLCIFAVAHSILCSTLKLQIPCTSNSCSSASRNSGRLNARRWV